MESHIEAVIVCTEAVEAYAVIVVAHIEVVASHTEAVLAHASCEIAPMEPVKVLVTPVQSEETL